MAKNVLPWMGFFVCLLGFTACTQTKQNFPIPGNPAPRERLLAFQQPHPTRTASLVMIREDQGTSKVCYMAVYLNDQLAARLEPNEWARFYVKPGPLRLRVDFDPLATPSMCGGKVGKAFQQELQLKVGKTLLLRASLN